MNTHSLIIYRNPLERQFWEGGLLFPVLCGTLITVLTIMLGFKLLDFLKIPSWSKKYKICGNFIIGIAFINLLTFLHFYFS